MARSRKGQLKQGQRMWAARPVDELSTGNPHQNPSLHGVKIDGEDFSELVDTKRRGEINRWIVDKGGCEGKPRHRQTHTRVILRMEGGNSDQMSQ